MPFWRKERTPGFIIDGEGNVIPWDEASDSLKQDWKEVQDEQGGNGSKRGADRGYGKSARKSSRGGNRRGGK